jgi:tetratricopeptide (TPR) repeat protein
LVHIGGIRAEENSMSIKVFISWSGNESQFVASRLQDFLKLICTAAEPWVSNKDLAPGVVWPLELFKQLQATYFGVICVNRSNLNSLWLHFEAGVLAKSLDSSAVFPYLIDCPPSALSGPLTLFQSINADREGTLKLVTALNNILRDKQEPHHSDGALQVLFDALWPKFKQELEQAPKVPLDAGPERSDSEILGEILTKSREHSRLLASLLRARPADIPPIQAAVQAAAKDAYPSLSFEELRFNAKNLRASGQFAEALDLFRKAQALQPGDLETAIDIAVTETYLRDSDYGESIKKLQGLIEEEKAKEQSPGAEESIIAKAYYNIACIKHIALLERDAHYTVDEIFGDLERAFKRYPAYINTALEDHDLAQIRRDSRFKSLVEKYRRAER